MGAIIYRKFILFFPLHGNPLHQTCNLLRGTLVYFYYNLLFGGGVVNGIHRNW